MLSNREKMVEFLVAVACGNTVREMLSPNLRKLTPQDMIQLAQEYDKTEKLNIAPDEFADLIADMDSILERVTDTLMFLVKNGNLFKDNFKN